MLQLKRVYATAAEDDGYRILVDRIWPRGEAKEKAKIDLWLKEIGPSKELRQSFHHEEITFSQFKTAYLKELETGATAAAFQELQQIVSEQATVTLLFASKNQTENQAVILKEVLEK
ncbi:DUF488 domain-containing protein [Enterococcus sp. HY326]|uniref:DUF488 domain-containing protein n=1 Tax=Enterococcus sp. HY326 TaxID=2971265 RepID=UPI00223F2037|nr:DUF488 family protein [Enterococcus sp. HY326]